MFAALILVLSIADGAVSGVVKDPSGAVISGATVIVQGPSGERQTVTGPNGRFVVGDVPDGNLTLVVRAGGFAEKKQALGDSRDVEVVLSPAALLETITVTPTRSEQRLGDVPASVSILDSTDIKMSPAAVADDVLRQVPTFSLFRRSSSLSSHPTTQGVSLRGIGPSGVSRTLVMHDGVPVNDPFGGWVYWTRIPLESVDRIEVVDGPTSSLYGNYAMGGVINIVPARVTPRTVETKVQFGNLDSPKGELFASDVFGRLGVSFDASGFDTDGFPIVAPSERRTPDETPTGVDTLSTVTYHNFNGSAEYRAADHVTVFGRTGYFHEDRNNGKQSTIDHTPEANNTSWQYVSGGVRAQLPDQSDLQVRAFGDFETFRSNFLAVPAANPPRSLGRMTLNQRVPATGFGSLLQWSRAFGSRQVVTAGTDFRWVDGESQEDGLDATTGTTVTLKRVSGGTQRSIGAFAQDMVALGSSVSVTGAVRLDHWGNYDGHNLETNYPSGTPTVNNNPSLPSRDDTVVSGHGAANFRISDRVGAWGALSSGFRAPTLNELYRQFRVGTVLTLANSALVPERLHGGEAGIRFEAAKNLTVRSTYFDNRVRDPVSNITIAQSGANVTQQRQNVGRTRIWGIQNDVDYRFKAWLRAGGGYIYEEARFKEFAANPALVGNYLQQVPKNRASVQVAYTEPRYVNVSFDMQFVGHQFDDDQNVRVVPAQALSDAGYEATTKPGLPGYSVWEMSVSRAVTRNIEAFFGIQNVADKQYFVGTLPTTIGSPRLYNGGVRVGFSGR